MNEKQPNKGRVGARGDFTFTVKGPDGKIKQRIEQKNIVVDAGLQLVLEHIFDASPTGDLIVDYIAVGDDNTAASTGDTQLGNEIKRKAVASRSRSGLVGACSVTFNAGEIPGAPLDVKEAGIFIGGTTSPNTGTLLCHVISNISITALDSLFIDWRLTLSDA